VSVNTHHVRLNRKIAFAYAMLIGIPAIVIWLVFRAGRDLTPVKALPPQVAAVSAVPAPLDLVTLVVQIAAILLVSRFVGILFEKIKQPMVVGEMMAGILLGPSVLGWVFPSVFAALFPAGSLAYLTALSQIGLVLFMFLIGVSLDPSDLRAREPRQF
jgi:hypothetical protein